MIQSAVECTISNEYVGEAVDLASLVGNHKNVRLYIDCRKPITVHDTVSIEKVDIYLNDSAHVTWISSVAHGQFCFYVGDSCCLYGVQVVAQMQSCNQELMFTMQGRTGQARWIMLPLLEQNARYRLVTKQLHTQSDTTSDVCVMAGALDQAELSYEGLIYVGSNLESIKTRQHCNLVTIGSGIRAHMRPCLEIYSPDVICTHAAALGKHNKELINYLASRGIGVHQAKKIMLKAQQLDAIDRTLDAESMSIIEQLLHRFAQQN